MPNDIQSVMNSETYYPFMSIYTYAVGSTSGATALVSPSQFTLSYITIAPLDLSIHGLSLNHSAGKHHQISYDQLTNLLAMLQVCDL